MIDDDGKSSAGASDLDKRIVGFDSEFSDELLFDKIPGAKDFSIAKSSLSLDGDPTKQIKKIEELGRPFIRKAKQIIIERKAGLVSRAYGLPEDEVITAMTMPGKSIESIEIMNHQSNQTDHLPIITIEGQPYAVNSQGKLFFIHNNSSSTTDDGISQLPDGVDVMMKLMPEDEIIISKSSHRRKDAPADKSKKATEFITFRQQKTKSQINPVEAVIYNQYPPLENGNNRFVSLGPVALGGMPEVAQVVTRLAPSMPAHT